MSLPVCRKHIEAAVTAMIVLALSVWKSMLGRREHHRGQGNRGGFVSSPCLILFVLVDPICLQELNIAYAIVSVVHKSPK